MEKQPAYRKRNDTRVAINCSHCGGRKLIKRYYLNAERRRGRSDFFCNISCSRQFNENNNLMQPKSVGYLEGAMDTEAEFYKYQRYG